MTASRHPQPTQPTPGWVLWAPGTGRRRPPAPTAWWSRSWAGRASGKPWFLLAGRGGETRRGVGAVSPAAGEDEHQWRISRAVTSAEVPPTWGESTPCDWPTASRRRFAIGPAACTSTLKPRGFRRTSIGASRLQLVGSIQYNVRLFLPVTIVCTVLINSDHHVTVNPWILLGIFISEQQMF